MDLLYRRHERSASLDTATVEEVIVERLIFIVLAVLIWIFIVYQLWTLFTTRRSLFNQLDAIKNDDGKTEEGDSKKTR